MNEENIQVQTESNDNIAYINAIQDLKESTVDKKLYNKIREERDALIKSLATGEGTTTVVPEARSLVDCREDYKNPTASQCVRMERLLALRDAAIREGDPDPFVAVGHHVQPTAYDYQRAEEIADIYKECLEVAEGNDKVFMAEFYKRMR